MPERTPVPDRLSPGDSVWVAAEAPLVRRSGRMKVPLLGAVGVLEEWAEHRLEGGRTDTAWVAWDEATQERIPLWYRRLCEHHGRDWTKACIQIDRLAPWTSETEIPASATPFASDGMERLRRRVERVSEWFGLSPEEPWPPRTFAGLQAAERALHAKLEFPFAADAPLDEGDRFVLVFDVFLAPADRAAAESIPSAPLPPSAILFADARDEHRPVAVPLGSIAAGGEAARWVRAYRLWRGR